MNRYCEKNQSAHHFLQTPLAEEEREMWLKDPKSSKTLLQAGNNQPMELNLAYFAN